jgi:hypothetical protein
MVTALEMEAATAWWTELSRILAERVFARGQEGRGKTGGNCVAKYLWLAGKQ